MPTQATLASKSLIAVCILPHQTRILSLAYPIQNARIDGQAKRTLN